jgi:uridine kinase
MRDGRQTKFIGIAGETASGKSTFCHQLLDHMPPSSARVLGLDSYYLSQEPLPLAEREHVNFDHPDAFDCRLLIDHVDKLCRGQDIQVPVYNFSLHVRLPDTIHLPWAPVVIIEGILALYWEELRQYYDYSVYIDAPESVRLKRRIVRDCAHRGRTRASVIDQWENCVRTMSAEFSAPTRQYADLVIDGEAIDDSHFRHVVSQCTDILGRGVSQPDWLNTRS